MLTCVLWQVTLCDPIWQVTLRSSVMDFSIKSYTHFYYLFYSLLLFQSVTLYRQSEQNNETAADAIIDTVVAVHCRIHYLSAMELLSDVGKGI